MKPKIFDLPQDSPLHNSAKTLNLELDTLISNLLFYPEYHEVDPINGDTALYLPPKKLNGRPGPDSCDVLVIGKCPAEADIVAGELAAESLAQTWVEPLKEFGLETENWIYTTVCPFSPPSHMSGKGELPAGIVKESLPFLSRTYALASPKYVICFGADAFKAVYKLFPNSKVPSFKDTRGTTTTLPDGTVLIPCINPNTLEFVPENREDFEMDLGLAASEISGQTGKSQEPDYSVVDTVKGLKDLVDVLVEMDYKLFSLDLEWGWDSLLRTIQVAWSDDQAAVIHFAHEGMKPTSLGEDYLGDQSYISHLERLFKREDVGLIGHNLRGDIEIFKDQTGIDLLPEFLDLEAGSFDTMLGHHLTNELVSQGLKLVSLRVLGTPRYDKALNNWLKEQGKGEKALDREAYGNIPDDILIPYSAWDAVVPFRLAKNIKSKFEEDHNIKWLYNNIIHPVNEPIYEMEYEGVKVNEDRILALAELFQEKCSELKSKLQKEIGWEDQIIPSFKPSKARQVNALHSDLSKEAEADNSKLTKKLLTEMIEILNKNVAALPHSYIDEGNEDHLERHLLNSIEEVVPFKAYSSQMRSSIVRHYISNILENHVKYNNKAGFNPDSSEQVVEVLFGMPPKNDPKRSKLPENVKPFGLTPVKSTEDKEWTKVIEQGKENKTSPAVDSESLSILSTDWDIGFLETLKHFKFVSQISKNFIRPSLGKDDNGNPIWEGGKGIAGNMSKDKRVRPSYRLTLETGRYSCRGPNLQQLPSGKEADIQEVFMDDNGNLDPRYKPITSVFEASPGCVLIAGDWEQAELYTLAGLSGDYQMKMALATGDLHTSTLIDVFGDIEYKGRSISSYSVEEYNHAREEDKYLHSLRVSIKSLSFGKFGRYSIECKV